MPKNGARKRIALDRFRYVRTLKLVQPVGIRSTRGIFPPPALIHCLNQNNKPWLHIDLGEWKIRFGVTDYELLTVAAEIRSYLNRAVEGNLKYDDDSSLPGTVAQIMCVTGVLEIRACSRSFLQDGKEHTMHIRVLFSEPEDRDCILTLGVLAKNDYPLGKSQQNDFARVCQWRGDCWFDTPHG